MVAIADFVIRVHDLPSVAGAARRVTFDDRNGVSVLTPRVLRDLPDSVLRF